MKAPQISPRCSIRPGALAVAFSLVALVALGGCRRVPDSAEAAEMVAWTLDVPGETLEEGRLRATPPGGEERLVPGVAEATRQWVLACGQPADKRIVTLGMTVSREGVVATTDSDRSDQLSKCLAAQARGAKLRGAVLAQNTRVDIALRFGSPAP